MHIGSLFGTSYDGTAAAKCTVINLSPANVTVPDGHFLTVRWSNIDHSGSEHELAIDDVAITLIPEPSSPLLVLCFVPALLRRRR
jgi:hypothetical protein